MSLLFYSKCECGAVTVSDEFGLSYSCKRRNLKRFLPGVNLRKLKKLPDTGCCDHCSNHWGLDLCACGSGEAPEKCKNRTRVCGMSMQKFDEYNHVVAPGGWDFANGVRHAG